MRSRIVVIVPLALSLAAALLALAAAASLGEAAVGRSTAVRGCNTELTGGLVLLVVSGLVFGIALVTARAVTCGIVSGVRFAPERTLLTIPGSVIVLVVAAPGVLGCSAAAALERFALLADAALGAPGIALAAAAAVMLGASVASGVDVVVRPWGTTSESFGLVDAVVEDIEARASAPGASSFGGVEPPSE